MITTVIIATIFTILFLHSGVTMTTHYIWPQRQFDFGSFKSYMWWPITILIALGASVMLHTHATWYPLWSAVIATCATIFIVSFNAAREGDSSTKREFIIEGNKLYSLTKKKEFCPTAIDVSEEFIETEAEGGEMICCLYLKQNQETIAKNEYTNLETYMQERAQLTRNFKFPILDFCIVSTNNNIIHRIPLYRDWHKLLIINTLPLPESCLKWWVSLCEPFLESDNYQVISSERLIQEVNIIRAAIVNNKLQAQPVAQRVLQQIGIIKSFLSEPSEELCVMHPDMFDSYVQLRAPECKSYSIKNDKGIDEIIIAEVKEAS